MHEIRRDVGLERAVTSSGLAASIINTVVGAGIFVVPAALADALGAYAPLAFLLCGVSIGSVAICFAEGGSRIPTSGGAYGYIAAAFGPLAGSVAGILLWFSNMFACAGVAAALADVTVSVLPKAWRAPVHPAIIVAAIGAIALVNVGGVAAGTRLVNAATVIKLIPLAIFIIAGAGALHRANFLQTVEPAPAGFGRAVILALFALTGMEVPLCASGEIAQPAKTIPRALALAILAITLLYFAIQVIAQGVLGSSLPQSAAPLADAMARVHPTLRLIMLAGSALSMFGYIGSDLLGSPRVLFAFARDGALPRVLGNVHPNSRVPHIAILCYGALAIGLAVTGTFAELAVLSTLGAAVLYILACIAAWRLARSGVALAGAPLNFRWLGCASALGVASSLVLILLAARAEILGLLALIAASVLFYLVRLRPRQINRARIC